MSTKGCTKPIIFNSRKSQHDSSRLKPLKFSILGLSWIVNSKKWEP